MRKKVRRGDLWKVCRKSHRGTSSNGRSDPKAKVQILELKQILVLAYCRSPSIGAACDSQL